MFISWWYLQYNLVGLRELRYRLMGHLNPKFAYENSVASIIKLVNNSL